MRPLLACMFVALLAACSPVDTGAGTTDFGGNGPVWSGPGADGGSPDGGASDGGGAADGGSGGGSTDGGTGGGGGSGGGSDGGTASVPPGCDGVVPTSNPPVRTATIPRGDGDTCSNTTADLAGNIAAESHSNHAPDALWQLWTPDGKAQGAARAGFDFYGQDQGFLSTRRREDDTSLVRVQPDGRADDTVRLGGEHCSGSAYLSAVGGVTTLGGCAGGPLVATRFDKDGKSLASRPVADKALDAAALTDAKGLTLVVYTSGADVGVNAPSAGRWFDANLAPVTGFFGLPGNGQRAYVRPLIGGGAAIQSGGNWVAVVASGAASSGDAPEFLATHPNEDVQLIRGGRAYALIPKAASGADRTQLGLYNAAGTLCGTGTFTGGQGLSVAIDGTVIASGGLSGCAIGWWPGVLR